MNRSRVTGDLTASGLLYADIANDRVGIGSTVPGNKLSLPDSAKIGLGNAEDLTLYHSGSHSFIQNSTGSLINEGNSVVLRSTAQENYLVATANGAVDLYYNNSKKLETTNTGAVVTGILTATGNVNFAGDVYSTSNNPWIYTSNGGSGVRAGINLDGTNQKIDFSTAGSSNVRLRIDSAGKLLVGHTGRIAGDVTAQLQVEGTSYHTSSLALIANSGASAGNNSHITLAKSRGSSDGSNTILVDDDSIGIIQWAASDGTDLNCVAANIRARVNGTPGSNDMPGSLEFGTTADGAAAPTERLRIDSSGRVMMGNTQAANMWAAADDLVVGSGSGDRGITIYSGSADVGMIAFADGTSDPSYRMGRVMYSHSANAMTFYTNGDNERLRIDSSGRLLLGAGAVSLPKGTGAGSFDLDSGSITMCVGGNVNSTGRTNSTDKLNRITSPHYTNAEEPVMLVSSYNVSGNNTISYGGGSSLTNAATQHAFYTAANTTTTNGTERLRITSAGVIETGTAVGGSGYDSNMVFRIGRAGDCNLAIRNTANTTSHTGIDFGDSGDDRSGRIQYMHNGDYMSFHTNGAGSGSSNERLRISSTGEVWCSTGNLRLGSTSGTDSIIHTTNAAGILYRADENGHRFQTYSGSWQDRLKIYDDGRIQIMGQNAIAATSLTHRLLVRSQNDSHAIAIAGRNGDHIGELSFYQSDASTKIGDIEGHSTHMALVSRAGYISFATGGTTEKLKIASDGVLFHTPSGDTSSAYLKAENNSTTYIQKIQKDGAVDTNLAFQLQDGGSLNTIIYLDGGNKRVAVGKDITPTRNLHVQEHLVVANKGTNGGQPYVSSTPILAVTTDGSNVVPGDTTYRHNALVSFGVGGHNAGNPGSNAMPGLGYFKLDLYGQTGLGDVGTNLDSTLSIRSINPNNTRLRIRTKDNYNGTYPHASISFTQQQSTEIGRIECISQTSVANRAHLDFHTNYGGLSKRMRITDTGRVGIGLDVPEGALHVRADTQGTDTAFFVGSSAGDRFFALNELSGQINFGNCLMSFYDNSLREILTLRNTYSGQTGMGNMIVWRGASASKTGDIRVYNTATNSAQSKMDMSASGGVGIEIDHNGHVNKPNQPYCDVTLDTSRTCGARGVARFSDTNGFGGHYFTNVRNNQGSHYNSGNSRFTVPTTGKYLICMNVALSNSDPDAYYAFEWYKNGSRAFYGGWQRAEASGYHRQASTTIWYLSKDDYLEPSFESDETITFLGHTNTNSRYTGFSIMLLG